jgi:ABC-type microcin C transport system duplicated ATPase subunit YejF
VTDDERREVSRLLEIDRLQTYFFSAAGVVKAVDGISFDINQGETIAIVGEPDAASPSARSRSCGWSPIRLAASSAAAFASRTETFSS